EPVFQRALHWLAWSLQDRPIHIEEPAVVAAPDTTFGDQAKLQRGAAMGTVQLEQPHLPSQVAERYECLPQNGAAPTVFLGVVRKPRRLTEAAKVFPPGRAGARVCDFSVFLWNLAVIVAAITGGQEGGSGCHDDSPSASHGYGMMRPPIIADCSR